MTWKCLVFFFVVAMFRIDSFTFLSLMTASLISINTAVFCLISSAAQKSSPKAMAKSRIKTSTSLHPFCIHDQHVKRNASEANSTNACGTIEWGNHVQNVMWFLNSSTDTMNILSNYSRQNRTKITKNASLSIELWCSLYIGMLSVVNAFCTNTLHLHYYYMSFSWCFYPKRRTID